MVKVGGDCHAPSPEGTDSVCNGTSGCSPRTQASMARRVGYGGRGGRHHCLGRILIFLGAVPDHPLAHWRSPVASPNRASALILAPQPVKERRSNECLGQARSQRAVPRYRRLDPSILSMALWTYAYFVTGTLWLIPWGNFLPRWAAEWLRINRASLGVGVSAVRWDVDEKTWKQLVQLLCVA